MKRRTDVNATIQVRLLRAAGVLSPSILNRLKDHDIEHVRYVIEHNRGHPGLIATKLIHSDWSHHEPKPKIFSDLDGVCPVCSQSLRVCHGLHGPAAYWEETNDQPPPEGTG